MDHEKAFLTSDSKLNILRDLRSALKTVDPFPKNYTTEVMLGNLVSTYTRFSNN